MISAKDRVPLYPGRAKMTPVSGQPNVYDMTRFDQPQQEGTPLNRRTMQLLQADIRTYPVKAGESVQAGDVVDVVGGGVGATWKVRPNRKMIFSSTATYDIIVCKLTERTGVIAGNHGSSLKIRAYSIAENGEINFSTEVSVRGSNCVSISVVRMTDTKFVITYRQGSLFYGHVGTFINSTLDIASEGLYRESSVSYGCSVPLSATTFFYLCHLSGLNAQVMTNSSGNTISTLSSSTLPGSTSAAAISATRLPDSGSNKRVCVCYSDTADGYKGKAVIATISASNVVTWGTPVVFEAVYAVMTSCCADGNDIIVSYSNQMNQLFARVLLVSNTTITLGPDTLTVDTDSSTPSLEKIESGFVLTYRTQSVNGGYSVALSRNGNSLKKGNRFQFNTGSALFISSVQTSERTVLVVYPDGGNSSYGTATLLEIRGDQIAGSFENDASQAIALKSGTSGQSIDVIFDGTAELPGITAGTSITSPGVQGYSPQDGWLWVSPEWDSPHVMASGSYIGTGTAGASTPNSLFFDFVPKIVIITTDSRDAYISPAIIFIHGQKTSGGLGNRKTDSYTVYGSDLNIAWNGKSLAWYSDLSASYGGASAQLNGSALTYRYVAFG